MTASAGPVRVRFAPSPTGKLHIGGARTALFNWAFARRHGGVFLLRVEDTDRARNTEASLESILFNLRWLGLDWDEGPGKEGPLGPYFQSRREEGYRRAAARLLEEGHAYRCFCTPERVEALKAAQAARKENPRYDGRCRGLSQEESDRRAAAGEPFTLRHAVPEGREVLVSDRIRGEVRFRSSEVEDWVLVRTSGVPTYNFCCVVDDAAMKISHVLRGEEHLVNTPKQVLLYEALGLPVPEFAHLPLILGKNGKKLSKRTGDTAVEDYRLKGCPPEALFNFLCLLGFSIDDHTEIFSPEDLVRAFDLGRVQKAGGVFDPEKLRWMCGEYIRRTPVPELTERVLPWLREASLVEGEPEGEVRGWLERVVASQQERIHLYGELPERVAFLFREEIAPDPKAAKALQGEAVPALLGAVADLLEHADPFPPPDFGAWAREVAAARGLGLGKVLKPVRAALSGALGGPPLEEILALLGRERSLRRLRP